MERPYDADVIARMYDGDYAAMRTPSGDVGFYVEEARRAGGAVLELACGTGRILIPTARSGVEIAGIDRSAGMLARARQKLAAEPAEVRGRVTLHEGDMCTLDLRGRFSLVTIPFRPIAHVLEIEQQLALFANARRHLASDGRVVFDFYHPDPALLVGPQEERLDLEREEDGRRIRRFSTTRPRLAAQVMEVTFRWEIEGLSGEVTEQRVEFPMRWYHRFELEHLLARCGLRVIELYGDFRRRPFADGAGEMVFVARASA
ncbi:MAG: class I SAM-dependent methyltransferase [Candidatus Rokuibacteriota bacterium]